MRGMNYCHKINKSLLRHRYHDFQYKDAVRTFYRTLAVVFFHRISDVGQSETVEKGVILGGFFRRCLCPEARCFPPE